MIFQHTIDLIPGGHKTQTRRRVKPGDVLTYDAVGAVTAVSRGGRCLWRVGGIYAVQRGRGKPAEGQIVVTQLRRERVRDITSGDARAEGVDTTDALDPTRSAPRPEWVVRFRALWDQIHGPGSFERDEVYAVTFRLAGGRA